MVATFRPFRNTVIPAFSGPSKVELSGAREFLHRRDAARCHVRVPITILGVFVIYRPLRMSAGWRGIPVDRLRRWPRCTLLLQRCRGPDILSVVFSAKCMILGMLLIMIGVLAELIAINRQPLKQVSIRVRRPEAD